MTGTMRAPEIAAGKNDGRTYRLFREVVLRSNPPQPTGGVFRVWFYTIMTPRQTMIMSQITKLFFFGMPGFRGKMWLVNDMTGEFGGIYQFETMEQARDYAHSFAMTLSKRRSHPGMFGVEYYAKDADSSLYRAQEHPVQVEQPAGKLAVGTTPHAS